MFGIQAAEQHMNVVKWLHATSSGIPHQSESSEKPQSQQNMQLPARLGIWARTFAKDGSSSRVHILNLLLSSYFKAGVGSSSCDCRQFLCFAIEIHSLLVYRLGIDVI